MKNTGRFYRADDLARIACSRCEGCGDCCRGMGDTIVLDPYDADQLSRGLSRPFADLLRREVALHAEGGLILPHLAMRRDASPDRETAVSPEESCPFLSSDGRCSIHSFRPGICRLYPLARDYFDGAVRYFVLPGACPGRSLSKERIRKYLGIPDIASYEAFKAEWHSFLKKAGEKAESLEDPDGQNKISLFILETFYLRAYESDGFYTVAKRRMRRAAKALRLS